MPMVVKLHDLLHNRRMTLTELAERIESRSPNLSILKTGKARAVRFSTLEAICSDRRQAPREFVTSSRLTIG